MTEPSAAAPGGDSGPPERRTRVLWLINQLGPGGSERLLISAAKSHDHRAFEFEAAYVLHWHNLVADELAAAGVRVHPLGVQRSWDLRWLWRLHRLVRDGSFDIVHAHSPAPAAIFRVWSRLVLRRSRPLLFGTEHNEWTHYRWSIRLLSRLTVALDDAHLTVSPTAHASLPRQFRSGTRILVHGIRVEEAIAAGARGPATRSELGITDDQILVVSVGNLRQQKNYPALLAAAQAVLRQAPNVRFVVVGGGPLESKLKARCTEMGLENHVRFLGYRTDALAILGAADIFCITSGWEGYPVAVMEALALGVPIVATAVGSVPLAVRQNVEGFVVDPKQPARIADALVRLAQDPQLRRQMADAARERGRSFGIENATKAIESIYRNALSQRAASGSPGAGPYRGASGTGVA